MSKRLKPSFFTQGWVAAEADAKKVGPLKGSDRQKRWWRQGYQAKKSGRYVQPFDKPPKHGLDAA